MPGEIVCIVAGLSHVIELSRAVSRSWGLCGGSTRDSFCHIFIEFCSYIDCALDLWSIFLYIRLRILKRVVVAEDAAVEAGVVDQCRMQPPRLHPVAGC